MPLFSSSGVIHDVLFLPVRCLILGGCCFSVCTRAESGYEREAPFSGHMAISSWSLMRVCVPDAEASRHLAPSQRPAGTRAGSFSR